MRIALINDTHAGARGENPHINEYFFNFWNNIFFPYLENNNIDTIVHLGDFVDRRKFINFKMWRYWRLNFFEKLKNKKMHLLLGNHDIYHKNTSEINAAEELLSQYPNITLYREPKDVIFDDLSIAMIPWINEGNQEQTFKFIEESKSEIAFGHLEISGFEMDKENFCKTGVDKSTFKKFKQVYTGHFHHKSDDNHIFYLGNQYEMTWADYDDIRGFHVFDTETQKIEFIKNPFKLFYKIVYNDEEQDLEYWNKFDYSKYANTFIKIIVCKKKNPFLYDTVLSSLYSIQPIDINTVEDYSEKTISEEKIDQAEDVPTILSKFIDNLDTELEKPKLKSIMRELYTESLITEHTS